MFVQSFFKFHKNDDNRKLKAWSVRLRKNDFCRLYNERARALQSSITFFLIHPVQRREKAFDMCAEVMQIQAKRLVIFTTMFMLQRKTLQVEQR